MYDNSANKYSIFLEEIDSNHLKILKKVRDKKKVIIKRSDDKKINEIYIREKNPGFIFHSIYEQELKDAYKCQINLNDMTIYDNNFMNENMEEISEMYINNILNTNKKIKEIGVNNMHKKNSLLHKKINNMYKNIPYHKIT